LASPGDYTELALKLQNSASLCFFKEYELGHMGLIIPKDRTHIVEMVELCRQLNPDVTEDYKPMPAWTETFLQRESAKLVIQD